MTTLEDVTSLKQQGYGDGDIINYLRQQGISPKEIHEALEHAQIKNAVSPGIGKRTQGMEPSILNSSQQNQIEDQGTEEAPSANSNYSPYAQEQQPQQQYQPFQQEQYQDPNTYNQGNEYAQQDSGEEYSPSAGVDTDTIMEISEQVFLQKIGESKKQLTELQEFKTITEAKVDNMNTRLQKIESIIDKLQMSILEKVSSYGENLDAVKQEMDMMENSFEKVLGKKFFSDQKKSVAKPKGKGKK